MAGAKRCLRRAAATGCGSVVELLLYSDCCYIVTGTGTVHCVIQLAGKVTGVLWQRAHSNDDVPHVPHTPPPPGSRSNSSSIKNCKFKESLTCAFLKQQLADLACSSRPQHHYHCQCNGSLERVTMRPMCSADSAAHPAPPARSTTTTANVMRPMCSTDFSAHPAPPARSGAATGTGTSATSVGTEAPPAWAASLFGSGGGSGPEADGSPGTLPSFSTAKGGFGGFGAGGPLDRAPGDGGAGESAPCVEV